MTQEKNKQTYEDIMKFKTIKTPKFEEIKKYVTNGINGNVKNDTFNSSLVMEEIMNYFPDQHYLDELFFTKDLGFQKLGIDAFNIEKTQTIDFKYKRPYFCPRSKLIDEVCAVVEIEAHKKLGWAVDPEKQTDRVIFFSPIEWDWQQKTITFEFIDIDYKQLREFVVNNMEKIKKEQREFQAKSSGTKFFLLSRRYLRNNGINVVVSSQKFQF